MENQSLWLGPLRTPIKYLAVVCASLTALLGVYMALGNLFGWSDIGMDQLLRPEGRILPPLFNWMFLASVVATSVYFSDVKAAIEIDHTGPFDIISLILSRIVMVAIVAIVLVMLYEVISRYVFEKGTYWANELSLWIAGFVFLFAGLYAMQQRSHIRISIIYDLMPRWMQKTSDTLSVLLIWVFAIALIWGGWNEVVAKLGRMETFGTAWDPPIPSTIKAAILLIILLVAIQALSNLIADWNKAHEHHSPLDEIDEVEIENIKKTLGED